MATTPRDPSRLSEQSAFIRATATTLVEQSNYSSGRLTLILGRFVDWAHRIHGLPLVPGLLFNREVIDLYIREAIKESELSKSSVATYRSVLLRAAEMYLPTHDAVGPVPVGARPSSAPYTDVELSGLTAWRRSQRTPLMRRKATAALSLGLGCGLRAREINGLRRTNVQVDSASDVVVSIVTDGTGREVPMLPRWARPFSELCADLEPDDYVFGDPHRVTENPNAISLFAKTANGGFALSTYRMRSTWIIGRLAAHVDLRSLLDAAGLERLEKLAEYLPYLPEPDDDSFEQLRREVKW